MPGQRKPPGFNGPAFARTLKNEQASQGMSVPELSRRSGVSQAYLATLRRGTPDAKAARTGQAALHPSIETIAGIADALNIRLSFVLSWAGFHDAGDRFTGAERRFLAQLLDVDPDGVDVRLRELSSNNTPAKETV